jgi:hypothetical protein
MNQLIGCCGLDCEKCDARIATLTNDNALREKTAALWTKLNGVTITPEMIYCTGCRIEGAKTPFCDKLQAELHDYETLRKLGIPMPRLLAVDAPQERILKEYIAGQTVAEKLKGGRMEPDWLAQVQTMCGLLYPAGLNIDYYPTNFVPRGGTLYYIDYECNAYMEQWDFEHWGVQYWTM